MKTSAIGWTDYSGSNGPWNAVTGCTAVDKSCANCYAKAIYKRWGRDFYTVRMHLDKLRRWYTVRMPEHSPKRAVPHKPMVFVCDTGDLFHQDVQSWFIQEAFTIMAARYNVTWQVLTKRPVRMAVEAQIWVEKNGDWQHWPEHVWLGVSVCDQETLNERLPVLAEIPAKTRFLSVEPMLAPVEIGGYAYKMANVSASPLAWVVCGGESGPHRRPFDVAWAEDLYHECKSLGVPFFFKQGSALRPGQFDELPEIGQVKEWPLE